MIKQLIRSWKAKQKITSIAIEITSKCNYSCNICPHKDLASHHKKHMSITTFAEILIHIKEFVQPNTTITLTGLGEPLLHPDLKSLIRATKIQYPKNRISLNTNGLLLNYNNSKMLIEELNEKDMFVISINADTPYSYQDLTNSKAFPVVLKNTFDFLRLRGDKGTPKVILRFLESVITDYERFKKLFMLRKNTVFESHPLLNWGDNKDMGISTVKDIKRKPCIALWSSIVIDVDGNVYPCCGALRTRGESNLFCGCVGVSLKEYIKRVMAHRTAHSRGIYIGDCRECDFWKEFYIK